MDRQIPVRRYEDGTEIVVNPRGFVLWSNDWIKLHDNPSAYGLECEFGGPATMGHVGLVLRRSS